MDTMRLTNLNWPAGLFIIGYHLALLLGLPFCFANAPPSLAIFGVMLLLVILNGLSIGVYHRCYSHGSYALHPIVESFFLLFSTMAFQSSVLKWSHDHRNHHRWLDGEKDPYSITKGFWHAHIFWIFRKSAAMDPSIIRDLSDRKILAFQHRYYGLLAAGINVAVVLIVGMATGNFLAAFVICWLLRMFIVHHVTWFVNSLAHSWGERTYSRELTAVDNFFLAFFTFGEGYHNYHHTFATDYRNGVRWYHFDPNKWIIWTLAKLQLASDLKRFDRYTIARRLLKEDRRLLLERFMTLSHARASELAQNAHELYERMHATLLSMHELFEDAQDERRHDKVMRRAYREKMRALKQQLRVDRRSWYSICKEVLGPKAIIA